MSRSKHSTGDQAMANTSALSNDELRSELRTFGVDAAITDSTRKVYEKKLNDLQKGGGGKRSKRPSTTPSVSTIERVEDYDHEGPTGRHNKRPTTTPSIGISERGERSVGLEDYEHEEFARPRLSFTPPYHAGFGRDYTSTYAGSQRDYSTTYAGSKKNYSSAHSVLAQVRSAAQDTPTSRSLANIKSMAKRLVPRLTVLLPLIVIAAVFLVFSHHLFGWPDVFPALLGFPSSTGNDGAKAAVTMTTSVVEESVVVPSRSFISRFEPDEI